MESRNVHLGLYIDKLNPFKLFVALYSSWLVILMVYNLPPGMCIRLKFIFLSTIIPDPNSLSQNIDVCLRLMINELKQFWSSKVLTYDVLTKQNF
jgi:hypothetical protein